QPEVAHAAGSGPEERVRNDMASPITHEEEVAPASQLPRVVNALRAAHTGIRVQVPEIGESPRGVQEVGDKRVLVRDCQLPRGVDRTGKRKMAEGLRVKTSTRVPPEWDILRAERSVVGNARDSSGTVDRV